MILREVRNEQSLNNFFYMAMGASQQEVDGLERGLIIAYKNKETWV
jgi:hypothetical protein